jgi:hypothetical protein
MDVPYTCVLPRTPTTAVPTVLYGHGLLGSQDEGEGVGKRIGASLGTQVCAVDWYGMSEQDVGAVLHILGDLSTFRVLPDIWDQEGCLLANDVPIAEEDYSGLAASEDRVSPFAEALKTHSAIILPNHGAITTGASIKIAIFRMLTLEGMAQRHLSVSAAARATGMIPKPISPDVAAQTKRELELVIARHGAIEMIWSEWENRFVGRPTVAPRYCAREVGFTSMPMLAMAASLPWAQSGCSAARPLLRP